MPKYLLNQIQFARKNRGGGVFKSPMAQPPPGCNFQLNSSPPHPHPPPPKSSQDQGRHAARGHFPPPSLPPTLTLLNNVNWARSTLGAQEAGRARRLTMAAAATRHLVAGPGPSHSFGAGARGPLPGPAAGVAAARPPGPPAPRAPHPAGGKRRRARDGAAPTFR